MNQECLSSGSNPNEVGLDTPISKQSQQFQGDIGDDLNVDRPMIASFSGAGLH
jgi:hypothetical protein